MKESRGDGVGDGRRVYRVSSLSSTDGEYTEGGAELTGGDAGIVSRLDEGAEKAIRSRGRRESTLSKDSVERVERPLVDRTELDREDKGLVFSTDAGELLREVEVEPESVDDRPWDSR
jgi:hypothetical protein